MATAILGPLLGSVIPGLAGLFGGGQQQKTQTNQSGSQSQQGFQSGQSTSTPNLNPFQQTLASLFSGGAADMYQKSLNLSPYTSQGLQQIQGQGAGNAKSIANNLAARGLSFSPAAATQTTQNQLNTGNQMNSFLQGIPLLQRQLQTSALDEMMKAFGTMPFGTSTDTSGQNSMTGTSNMSGTNVQSGNPMGGLFGGLGAGLFSPNAAGTGSNMSSILNMFKPKPTGANNSWDYGG